MASIQMNRGTKAEIDNTPITDGLISFDTDDNYIYLDNGDTRESFGGVKVIPNPEEEPTEILRNLQIAEDVYKISGGHEIENQSGTTLTQRDVMQFTGAYSHDDSTSEVTKIDIVREMTATQKDNLTNGEAEGFQWTTDENDDLPLTAEWVAYDSNKNVKQAIDDADLREGGTIGGSITIDEANGTTSAYGSSGIVLGNNKNGLVQGNSRGRIGIFSTTDKYTWIYAINDQTANRTVFLPDRDGTIALANGGIVSSKTKTATLDNVDIPVDFRTYANGVKEIAIASAYAPTGNITINDFVPSDYRPNYTTFALGFNSAYNNASNVNRGRGIALTNDGKFYIYSSNELGLWLNYFYTI